MQEDCGDGLLLLQLLRAGRLCGPQVPTAHVDLVERKEWCCAGAGSWPSTGVLLRRTDRLALNGSNVLLMLCCLLLGILCCWPTGSEAPAECAAQGCAVLVACGYGRQSS